VSHLISANLISYTYMLVKCLLFSLIDLLQTNLRLCASLSTCYK